MEDWDEPHWSGRPQAKPDTRPKLKPNLFARLARFSVRHAPAVLTLLTLLCVASASIAALKLRVDPSRSPIIALDERTAAAEAALDQAFPGIDHTFVARIDLNDGASAKTAAAEAAIRLSERTDLFRSAFVPEQGAFYENYGLLFQPREQIEARVAQAVQMQPLLHALGQAPDVPGLAALVTVIAEAIADGHPPPGLAPLLDAAAASVESNVAGSPARLNWKALAGLDVPSASPVWFVIATPIDGKTKEAAGFAQSVLPDSKSVDWSFPAGAQPQPGDFVRDLIVPALVAALLVLTVLGMGLGSLRLAAAVGLSVAASLILCAAAACLFKAGLDAVSWSFAAACLAPSLLFSILMSVAYQQARLKGGQPQASVMLAAQRKGPLLSVLALIASVFWLVWLPRQLPSVADTALIAIIGVIVALLVSLIALPALLVNLERRRLYANHWLDLAADTPAGTTLLNLRQVFALLVIAASVFSVIFLPGLRFGDPPAGSHIADLPEAPATRDAVHFVVNSQGEAEDLASRLALLPQTGALLWASQFLPQDVQPKLTALHQLSGLFDQGPVPREEPDATALASAFTDLETALRAIAGSSAPEDLRSAAARLRSAFAAFTAEPTPPSQRIAELNDALFGGLEDMSAAGRKLGALQAPALGALDPGLLRRFISQDGKWQIEAVAKPGINRLAFAAAMRRVDSEAAGPPIVALARSEILHHETVLALGMALAVAALIALAYLRRRARAWIATLVPVGCLMTLSAAILSATGQTVISSGLAAAVTAISACLSASLILVDFEAEEPGAAIRAAVLPVLALLGAVAPLSISSSPAVSAFGLISMLFLALSIILPLLLVPQIMAWTGARKPV
ncbi:hypothetical protein [Aestuariivirga sp.]|uniref:hypothetical protein n=1 Tax=Aestuariivirga sp. TaxID=2650926 RepID=UPI0039E4FF47